MHVAFNSVVLSGVSFDGLCKSRENWMLGSVVPVMTSASRFFKKIIRKKTLRSFPPPVNIKCILLLVLINFQPCLFEAFSALVIN